MFNVDMLGSYNEKDFQKCEDEFLKGCIEFKEPATFLQSFFKNFIIIFPLLMILIIGILIKIRLIDFLFTFNNIFKILISACIIALICNIIHKLLHAVLYPSIVIKNIIKNPKLLYGFYNFNIPISKKKFILISIFPNLILGFLPFMIWMLGLFDYQTLFSQSLIIIAMINIFAGIRDYFNIYSTIKQVPDNAYVFNYGIRTYWYYPENKKMP